MYLLIDSENVANDWINSAIPVLGDVAEKVHIVVFWTKHSQMLTFDQHQILIDKRLSKHVFEYIKVQKQPNQNAKNELDFALSTYLGMKAGSAPIFILSKDKGYLSAIQCVQMIYGEGSPVAVRTIAMIEEMRSYLTDQDQSIQPEQLVQPVQSVQQELLVQPERPAETGVATVTKGIVHPDGTVTVVTNDKVDPEMGLTVTEPTDFCARSFSIKSHVSVYGGKNCSATLFDTIDGTQLLIFDKYTRFRSGDSFHRAFDHVFGNCTSGMKEIVERDLGTHGHGKIIAVVLADLFGKILYDCRKQVSLIDLSTIQTFATDIVCHLCTYHKSMNGIVEHCAEQMKFFIKSYTTDVKKMDMLAHNLLPVCNCYNTIIDMVDTFMGSQSMRETLCDLHTESVLISGLHVFVCRANLQQYCLTLLRGERIDEYEHLKENASNN